MLKIWGSIPKFMGLLRGKLCDEGPAAALFVQGWRVFTEASPTPKPGRGKS